MAELSGPEQRQNTHFEAWLPMIGCGQSLREKEADQLRSDDYGFSTRYDLFVKVVELLFADVPIRNADWTEGSLVSISTILIKGLVC
jgi:hypothetical protein